MLQQLKKNWLQYLIGIVIVIAIIRIFRATSKTGAAGIAPTGGVGVKKVFKCDDSATLNRTKVLKKGVNNSQEVCYLQGWLNQWFNAGLKQDGDFGAATEKALVQFTGKGYGSLDWIGA